MRFFTPNCTRGLNLFYSSIYWLPPFDNQAYCIQDTGSWLATQKQEENPSRRWRRNKLVKREMPTALDQRPEEIGFTHLQSFNPNPKTLTWERLENKRLSKLGLGSKRYSRHFQRFQRESTNMSDPLPATIVKEGGTSYVIIGGEKVKMNSIAPFYTEEKPTCGYFFSRQTDNKKKKFGIPPSDLVKWRSFVQWMDPLPGKIVKQKAWK